MKNTYPIGTRSTMQSGFTMIELIFVIVIIGILASIAIPRLTATRNDAHLSITVSNMDTCIRNSSSYYTATAKDYTEANHPDACELNNRKCYDILYAVNGLDFNVTTNTTRESFCADIENVGGHLAKSYDFAGQTIKL